MERHFLETCLRSARYTYIYSGPILLFSFFFHVQTSCRGRLDFRKKECPSRPRISFSSLSFSLAFFCACSRSLFLLARADHVEKRHGKGRNNRREESGVRGTLEAGSEEIWTRVRGLVGGVKEHCHLLCPSQARLKFHEEISGEYCLCHVTRYLAWRISLLNKLLIIYEQ